MPRPKLRDIQRFHHLKGIPDEFQSVLWLEPLRYSAHAVKRYASRVAPLLPDAARPSRLNADAMVLLAADVVENSVVMQVWRMPLAGSDQDLVLAVSDEGRVATVWVVDRNDVDGIWRPKPPAEPAKSGDGTSVSLQIDATDSTLWGDISARRSRAFLAEPAPTDVLGLRDS